MTTDDVMLVVVDALNREKIPAMLVGSFSSNYYGIPRSTEDVEHGSLSTLQELRREVEEKL